MNESPPPPPTGATVREWFAGLALMNPTLMQDLSPTERAVEAARLADELVRALAVPRMPTQESLAAPSAEEMAAWDTQVAEARVTAERQSKATMPDIRRRKTAAYDFTRTPPSRPSLPPPPPVTQASVHFRRASDALQRPTTPGKQFIPVDAGRYSAQGPISEPDDE